MKKYGIVGALLIVAAVVVSYFFDFSAESIVSIAAASFGLAGLICTVIKDRKAEKLNMWPVYVCVLLSVVSGVLCFIGGLSTTVFAEIAGATIALLAVIFGIKTAKKKK